jgi:hypothetical protein
MSSGKIIALVIIAALLGLGTYIYTKHRTVSPELSAYVQSRYAKQLTDHKVDNLLLVDVFGPSNIGVLETKRSSFFYWISSTSYDEKYQVSKIHKGMLVGMAIVKDKGRYQVLLPRSAKQLTEQQLRTYIDNVSTSQIRQAQIEKVGLKS